MTTTASAHLSDDDVSRFVSGSFSSDERAAVRGHIDECAQCRSTVFAISETQASGDADPPSAPRLAERSLVGRYIVLELIGSGGMGAVYAAVDPKLGRRVALKLLRADRTTLERRDLLLREAQVLARLNHPNVATIYDVGDVDGSVFVAMELVEGGTLRDWLRARRRGWREVLEQLTAAGDGLDAIHRAGLVHHDFKPDNVLIGADGRPRVTDFGLAIPIGTRLDRRSGTPAYMAPEQMLGDLANAQADIFAFCVTLWEALHGERPFEGTNRSTLRDAIEAGAMREPPRDRAAPGWVRRLIASGLRANPDDRPPSMAALLRQLRADPKRRQRRWALIAGVVCLAAGGGIAAARLSAARAASCARAGELPDGIWNKDRREAIQSTFAKTGAPYASVSFRSVAHAVDEYVRGWSAMRVDACEATRVRRVQPDEVMALRMTCLDDRARALGAATHALASVDASTIGGAIRVVDELAPASECADATSLAKRTPRPRDPSLRARLERAMGRLDDGAALTRLGLFEEAVKATTEARAELDAVGHSPTQARAAIAHAQALARLGRVDEATRAAEDAVEAAERGHDDEAVTDALSSLVFLRGVLGGQPTEALRYARWALAAAERAGDPSLLISIRLHRGLTLSSTDRLEDALADLQFVVAEKERRHGSDHLATIEARSNLGIVLSAEGRLVEAGAQFQRAVDAFDRVIGKGTPESIPARNNLGVVQVQLGRLAEARATLEPLVVDSARAFGKGSVQHAPTLINLGELRLAEGHYTEASALLLEALTILERMGSDHLGLCEPLTQLSLVRLGEGKPAEALPLVERALTTGTKRGLSGTELARTQLAMARALTATRGDRDRARALAASAEKIFRAAAVRFGGENARWANDARRILEDRGHIRDGEKPLTHAR